MTPFIQIEHLTHAFGPTVLLDKVKFQINPAERICLIGRNGAGKSTLLKLIEKSLQPQEGTVWHQPHLRVARLEQVLPDSLNQTVYDFVASGLAEIGQLLSDYAHLTTHLSSNPTENELEQLSHLQRQLDLNNAWQFENTIQSVLSKLSLDPQKLLSALSGGWLRRAALAKTLVTGPDLLLLDEPTNHLDIEAIQWLESYLLSANISLVFITHDRALLQRLATRIIELDRGNLTSWPGDYQNFLRRKAEMLNAEDKLNDNFDKKLAQEEVWIRQGVKARRTRNEGRVRALEALRLERTKRREQEGQMNLQLTEAARSGKLVVEAKHLTHQYGDRILINDFSLNLIRGDRIGLMGPNGVGKSTLLNLLLGTLPPQQGSVQLGTKLDIAYFDQKRSELMLEQTAIENVAQGSDFIEINGNRKHIVSYLNDFLFTPQRAMTPVKLLSGGECNRLLLAKLFSRPTNLIVMDEPTNDLDIESLELLEELLNQFQGTLLLVSHDRQFIDNVVTSTLVFEENGHVQEYIGGYDDWLKQRAITSSVKVEKTVTASAPPRPKNQTELKQVLKQIATLEEKIAKLQQQTTADGFYQQDQDRVSAVVDQLKDLNKALEVAYARWEELE
ncbi:MAG: ATP-binding cassette domain-containing protein [Gammaproteobacteria bacterium]|nr:ATP-binding cassette domain-containing protein [Gammaproteobacteria bacterium]